MGKIVFDKHPSYVTMFKELEILRSNGVMYFIRFEDFFIYKRTKRGKYVHDFKNMQYYICASYGYEMYFLKRNISKRSDSKGILRNIIIEIEQSNNIKEKLIEISKDVIVVY